MDQNRLVTAQEKTFLALCEAILSGELVLDELSLLKAEDAMEKMTAIKGIGPWTAEVYLLFAVGHADIFPAGDLALQIAMGEAYKMNAQPNEKQVRLRAQKWTPWRGVAARLLWAYYAQIKGRKAMP